MNVIATVSVEEAADRETTWIEETIVYSVGKSRVTTRCREHTDLYLGVPLCSP